MEIWLRGNARVVLIGLVVPAIVAVVGGGLWIAGSINQLPWLRGVGLAAIVVAAGMTGLLLWQTRQPRLAYRDGHVYFWLRGGNPIRVPIDALECFWLGQTDSQLPGKQHARTEVAALVVRVADRATDWRHQDVKPQLGKWCEGYITIRGTWCEPLHLELVNRLNQRLSDLQKAARPASPA